MFLKSTVRWLSPHRVCCNQIYKKAVRVLITFYFVICLNSNFYYSPQDNWCELVLLQPAIKQTKCTSPLFQPALENMTYKGWFLKEEKEIRVSPYLPELSSPDIFLIVMQLVRVWANQNELKRQKLDFELKKWWVCRAGTKEERRV